MRRTFTPEQKLAILTELDTSGISMTALSKKFGIDKQMLWKWKKQRVVIQSKVQCTALVPIKEKITFVKTQVEVYEDSLHRVRRSLDIVDGHLTDLETNNIPGFARIALFNSTIQAVNLLIDKQIALNEALISLKNLADSIEVSAVDVTEFDRKREMQRIYELALVDLAKEKYENSH